jgi:hypothetical protein
MKAKLLLLILLSFVFYLLSSQVPQGFNYQAIARDGSGNPITELINVKIAILSDTVGIDDVIWEEMHTAVDPDDHGLFSIVVGDGTRVSGLASFGLIDWKVTPLYIRTMINDKELGSAQLWSVPYAMVADSLGGPLKMLKVVAATGSGLEDALFEVKNRTGQTVFAVYNEGVRIYIGDGTIKSPKGGFSVGGFGSDKDENNKKYLFVDDDSVRIYVNDLGKSAKGGFAVGGFGYTKEDPVKKYLFASEDSVRIYIDDSGKSAKGGFSVGGFTADKGFKTGFLNVTPDSTRIYVNEPESTINNYGFSVIGRKPASNIEGDYMSLGRYNSKIYSYAPEMLENREYTSWNLIVGPESLNDTIKLIKAAYAKLFMTIPYGGDETKGEPAKFEVNTIQTDKGLAAKVLSVGLWNVGLGSGAGNEFNGWNNIYIGNMEDKSYQQFYGHENVIIGFYKNYTNDMTPSDNNVLIGTGMAFRGSNSVCIGAYAGSARPVGEESNKLYIENSAANNTGALIYGEFDNDLLRLNARVTIRDALKLQPRTSPPAGPSEGEIYYNSISHKLFVHDGTTWQPCW